MKTLLTLNPHVVLLLSLQVEQKEEDLSPADLEELELRKKLDELTEKISDKGSSDEEDAMKPSEDSPKKGAVYHAPATRGASGGPGNVIHEWPLEAEWVRVWKPSALALVC